LASVGLTYLHGTVRGPTGIEADVRFLIDSGAGYSLLPESVWKAIGLVAPLLGVVTLETLGLVFDPFGRRLRPMRALLA